MNLEITTLSSCSDRESLSASTPDNPFAPFAAQDIDQSIASRFEQIVARDPSRLAVKTEGQTVSYGALNKMANRIAHAILSKSDASNEPVALLVKNDLGDDSRYLRNYQSG